MIKNAPIISIVCMPFSCGPVPAGFRRSERFRFTRAGAPSVWGRFAERVENADYRSQLGGGSKSVVFLALEKLDQPEVCLVSPGY